MKKIKSQTPIAKLPKSQMEGAIGQVKSSGGGGLFFKTPVIEEYYLSHTLAETICFADGYLACQLDDIEDLKLSIAKSKEGR